jgi:hypothetical protein
MLEIRKVIQNFALSYNRWSPHLPDFLHCLQVDNISTQDFIGILTITTLAEIGIGLTAVGLFFTILGVALFFDGALLAVGNVSLDFLPCLS